MVNPKFNIFHNNTRYFLLTGGRGSGKSFAVALNTLILSFDNKCQHKILFTGYTCYNIVYTYDILNVHVYII